MRKIGTLVSVKRRRWHTAPADVRQRVSGCLWHTRSDLYVVAGSWVSQLVQAGTVVGDPYRPRRTLVRSWTSTTHSMTPLPPHDDDDDPWTTPNTQHHQQRRLLLLHDEYWVNKVETGKLCYDADQKRAAQRLQRLQITLQGYTNEPVRQAYYAAEKLTRQQQRQQPLLPTNVAVGAVTNALHTARSTPSSDPQQQPAAPAAPRSTELSHLPPTPPPPPPPKFLKEVVPRGIFLYGSVGTGKSMLMDAFLAHTDCRRRRRYHFHEFMADVHRRLHARKLHYDQEKARARKKEEAAAAVRHHPMEDNDDDNHADLSPAAAAAAAAKINGSPPPSSRQDYVNPVTAVALEMAAEMSLLCLDEFQVLDVADAAILSQLFAILFRVGTVLVTTSNRPVTEIYRDGLHQQQQQQDTHGTPLIRSLQRHCILHPIQSDTDYRLLLSPSKIPSSTTTTTTTSTVAGTSNSRVIDAVDKGGVTSMFFVHAADDDENDGDELAPKSPPFEGLALRALTNQVFGDGPSATAVVVVTELPDVVMDTGFQRTLRVRTRRVQKVGGSGRGSNSAFTLACCTFDELCSGHFVSLCATDYRALARAPQVWDAIVVENIPVLSDSSTERGTGHNQARRFITLIDELYEAKVPLLCSAMAPPSQLFVCTTANRSTTTVGRGKNENDLEDDDSEIFGIDQAVDSQRHAVSALASVKELPFAFRRAASRLVEMTSLKWWKPVLDKIRDEPRNLSGE